MKKLVFLRRSSQILFLLLFIYILWSTTYPLQGGISPEIFFKVDPLIMLLTAVSQRVLLSGLLFSFLMIGLTLVLGRFFCGWVCPLGTMIDAFAYVRCLLSGRRSKGRGILAKVNHVPSFEQNQKIKNVKYFFLGVFFIFALLGVQVSWMMDPIVTLARVVSLNVIPAVTYSIDQVFIRLIQQFELYGPVYDFYRDLKANVLGVRIHFFANSLITFFIFLVIGFMSFFVSRLWCRMLCPLGALYSLFSSYALLERRVDSCRQCGLCRQRCRMGAIKEENQYLKSECILCMDCIYDCPTRQTKFVWHRKSPVPAEGSLPRQGMSRRSFLFLIISSWASLGAGWKSFGQSKAIRPPGVKEEKTFLNTCVRCGNCMKVCITNGLQPVMLESGWQGIWTPQLVPEIGYCEYQCTLCGNVCPTGAIPKLPEEKKKKARMGVAQVDRSLCLAWAQGKQCIVCEEHCPVSDKAIKLETRNSKIPLPVVDPDRCIGCGICQNKCPVSPVRAIRVTSTVT